MKKVSLKEWFLLIAAAVLGCGLWFKFSYPQFSFVDLSVDKPRAVAQAKDYLASLGVDSKNYQQAVIFQADEWADRYLQKAIGFPKEQEFFKKHAFEIFGWKIRFFRPLEKEEYFFTVGSSSGEILDFSHLLEDTAPAIPIDKDSAKLNAENFLEKKFNLDFGAYEFNEELARRYERRIDYSFSWQRKDVYIPWGEVDGGARLLSAATVSGDGISEFYKNVFDIPEGFRRYIKKQMVFGEYLFSFHLLALAFLAGSAMFILFSRKDRIVVRFTRRWFSLSTAFIVILNLLFIANNLQEILYKYPTSVSLASYFGAYILQAMLNLMVFYVIILVPALAGEALTKEFFRANPYQSFSHYLRSTFICRAASRAVICGYLLFFTLLGTQAIMFSFGQKYFGVWKEWFNFTKYSSAYLPFFSAFAVGVTAGFGEEITFRLFGISWGKKYLRSTALAVIFSALIWGFGHTRYPVFPVWFRGIETSILGVIFALAFLRYGIITVVVAHYLFDVFWDVSASIFGQASPALFSGGIFVLAIPLIFALCAYIANKEDKEKEISAFLSLNQRYNLNILINFIHLKKSQGAQPQAIARELVSHNWDEELVSLAVKEAFGV